MSTATTENAAGEGKGLRNFKNSADVENFYRFVHENGLRREAKLIMSSIVSALTKKKKKKTRKRRSKKLQ